MLQATWLSVARLCNLEEQAEAVRLRLEAHGTVQTVSLLAPDVTAKLYHVASRLPGESHSVFQKHLAQASPSVSLSHYQVFQEGPGGPIV